MHFQPLKLQDLPTPLHDTWRKWDKLAQDLNFSGDIAYKITAGFTLKKHAPKLGNCYEDFNYLQNWTLKNDEPTKDGIVFFIPRLIKNSTNKNKDEQLKLMAEVRKEYQLPDTHLTSFGSAALLTGLILTYFNNTGERTPLDDKWVRTDTLRGDGYRLCVGRFGVAGPCCGGYYWVDDGYDGLGVFALGVELGLSDTQPSISLSLGFLKTDKKAGELLTKEDLVNTCKLCHRKI